MDDDKVKLLKKLARRAKRARSARRYDDAINILEAIEEPDEAVRELLEEILDELEAFVAKASSAAERACADGKLDEAEAHISDIERVTKRHGERVAALRLRLERGRMRARARERQLAVLQRAEEVLRSPTYGDINSSLGELRRVDLPKEFHVRRDDLLEQLNEYHGLNARLSAIATSLELMEDTEDELAWLEEKRERFGSDYVEPVTGKTVAQLYERLVERTRDSYKNKLDDWLPQFTLALHSHKLEVAELYLDKVRKLRQNLLDEGDRARVRQAGSSYEEWIARARRGEQLLAGCAEALAGERWSDALTMANDAHEQAPGHPQLPGLYAQASSQVLNRDLRPVLVEFDQAEAALREAENVRLARELMPDAAALERVRHAARLMEVAASNGDALAKARREELRAWPERIEAQRAAVRATARFEARLNDLAPEDDPGRGDGEELKRLSDDIGRAVGGAEGVPAWLGEVARRRLRLAESARSRAQAVASARQALSSASPNLDEAYRHLAPHAGSLRDGPGRELWHRVLRDRGKQLLRSAGLEAAETSLRQALEVAANDAERADVKRFLGKIKVTHQRVELGLERAAGFSENREHRRAFDLLETLLGEDGGLDASTCSAENRQRLRARRREQGEALARELVESVRSHLGTGDIEHARSALAELEALPALFRDRATLGSLRQELDLRQAKSCLASGKLEEALGVLGDLAGRGTEPAAMAGLWKALDEKLVRVTLPDKLVALELDNAVALLEGVRGRGNLPADRVSALGTRVDVIRRAKLMVASDGDPIRAFRLLCRPANRAHPEAVGLRDAWLGSLLSSERRQMDEDDPLRALCLELPLQLHQCAFDEADPSVRAIVSQLLPLVGDLDERYADIEEDVRRGEGGLDKRVEKERKVLGVVEDCAAVLGVAHPLAAAATSARGRLERATARARIFRRADDKARKLIGGAKIDGLWRKAAELLEQHIAGKGLEDNRKLASRFQDISSLEKLWIEVAALMGADDPKRPAQEVIERCVPANSPARREDSTIQHALLSEAFSSDDGWPEFFSNLGRLERLCGEELDLHLVTVFRGPTGEKLEGSEVVRERAGAMRELYRQRSAQKDRFHERDHEYQQLVLRLAHLTASADMEGLSSLLAAIPGISLLDGVGVHADADRVCEGAEQWPALPTQEEIEEVMDEADLTRAARELERENRTLLGNATNDLRALALVGAKARERVKGAREKTSELREDIRRARAGKKSSDRLLDDFAALVVLAPLNPTLLWWLRHVDMMDELRFDGFTTKPWKKMIAGIDAALDDTEQGPLLGADLTPFFVVFEERMADVLEKASWAHAWERLRRRGER